MQYQIFYENNDIFKIIYTELNKYNFCISNIISSGLNIGYIIIGYRIDKPKILDVYWNRDPYWDTEFPLITLEEFIEKLKGKSNGLPN